MHTANKADENFAKLAALFPNAVTEAVDENGDVVRAIDKDILMQEISTTVVEGRDERYQFTWPNKRDAILLANAPIAETLRPCRAESVDFDTTENLYIEGDNLDVLKLLQETYLGKVKMIYIDPPYNTGNDFVYEDDFAQSTDEYMENSGQYDADGNRLFKNNDSNGRFHTDWLNMIYPRLKLAKDLLRDDGVIFISIDDNEVENLKKVCDEVFGEENSIGNIIWKNATDNNPTQIAIEHEYIICYAKQKYSVESIWKTKVSGAKTVLINIGLELNSQFEDEEMLQEAYSKWFRQHKSQLWPLDRYKYIDAGGVYTGSQSVHNPGRDGYRYDIIHPVTQQACTQPLLGYRFPETTMRNMIESGKILFGEDHNKIVEIKVYAKDYEEKLSSVFELDGRLGSYDLKALFGEKPIFSNPKPIQLIQRLLSFITDDNDIILDFFSGSATLAQAVLELNHVDGKYRKFICVQLPENLEQGLNEATQKLKAILKNALQFLSSIDKEPLLSELGKERIRRAGTKIKVEVEEKNNNLQLGEEPKKAPDIGFRVLKLDSTNMKDVYYNPNDYDQQMLGQLTENIKEDRTAEDLLFQVMLELGVLLSSKIEQYEIAGKTIYDVADGYLVACFDNGLTDEIVTEIAKKQPYYFVTRDNAMDSDSVSIDFEQIFETYSKETIRKVL